MAAGTALLIVALFAALPVEPAYARSQFACEYTGTDLINRMVYLETQRGTISSTQIAKYTTYDYYSYYYDDIKRFNTPVSSAQRSQSALCSPSARSCSKTHVRVPDHGDLQLHQESFERRSLCGHHHGAVGCQRLGRPDLGAVLRAASHGRCHGRVRDRQGARTLRPIVHKLRRPTFRIPSQTKTVFRVLSSLSVAFESYQSQLLGAGSKTDVRTSLAPEFIPSQ